MLNRAVHVSFVLLLSTAALVGCGASGRGVVGKEEPSSSKLVGSRGDREGLGGVKPETGPGNNAGKRVTDTKEPLSTDPSSNVTVDVNIPEGHGEAWDLLDNRASLMTYSGDGLVVRCGEPDFAKYIDGTWKNPWTLGQSLNGHTVAYLYKNKGKLYLPTPDILKKAIVNSRERRVVAVTKSAAKEGLKGGLSKEMDLKNESATGGKGTKTAVLVLKIHSLFPNQKMAVKVNGKFAVTGVSLSQGGQKVRVPFPVGLLRANENIITIYFKRVGEFAQIPLPSWRNAGYYSMRWVKKMLSGGALEAVGLGDESFDLPPEAVSSEGYFSNISWEGKRLNSLILRDAASAAFHLLVPKNARLFFHYRMLDRDQIDGKTIQRDKVEGGEVKGNEIKDPGLSISLLADGRPEKQVYSGRRKRGEWTFTGMEGGKSIARKGIVTATVDLSSMKDQAVRVLFDSHGRGVELFNIKLTTPKEPVIPISDSDIKYVFLWIADTLRKDSVGAYGSKIVKTPNFDALARRGVLFEKPTIQGNHSKPSMGTIFTGNYPPVHGFVYKKARVKGTLIQEQFKKAGWKTAMFSSNGYVSSRWGFGRGLDKNINFIRSNMPSASKYLWKHAEKYLRANRANKEGPLFMSLLTIDPHVSYDPPYEFLKMYYPGRYKGPVPRRATGFFIERLITGRVKLRRAKDLRRLKALYRAEVSYNDHWFGVMMKRLEEMGILDQSLIIMAADHGEQFKDHGSFGHAKNLHEEEIAVPLILWWPGLKRKGVRVSGDVEVMDIYSTILDLAGVDRNPDTQSTSLLPRIRGGAARAMSAAFSYHAGSARSVTMGRYKLITVHAKNYDLYDMKKDPGEQTPVTKKKPVALRLLRNVYSLHNAYMDRWRKSRWGRASNLSPNFVEDMYPKKSNSAD